MAIIYTYPVKGTPLAADLLLISDTADGNKSKNATIASLVTSNAIDVVDTVTASGAGITASPNKGDVVIANTGVTSLVAGSNIDISGSTGAVTISTSANVDGSGTANTIPKWSDSNTLTDSIIKDQGGVDVLIPRFIKHDGDTDNLFGFNGLGKFLVSVDATAEDQFSVESNSIIMKTDSGTKLAAGPTGVTLYSDTSETTTTTSVARFATATTGAIVYGQTVAAGAASERGGIIRYYNNANDRYVGISGPITQGANYQIRLPDSVGTAGQVLKLNTPIIGGSTQDLVWDDASGDVYTAGDNIAISGTNVISATNTTYTAGTNISISGTNAISSTTPLASTTVVGGFNLLSNTTGAAPTVIYTTAGRNYAIQRDSSGRAMVNVPWTDASISLSTIGTGAATLISGVLNIPTPPTITASQGLTKTSNDITLDIADPTTGWAILGGGAGTATPVISGYAGANATGNKNFGISNFTQSSTVTSANNNVAVGFQSMGNSVTTASDNVVVGHEAGESMTTSNESVLIGKDAGEAITTGGENTIIGANAGETITTGTRNTIIGSGAIAGNGGASQSAVAIGREASATTKSTAVGSGATVAGVLGTAIGNGAGTASNAPNGIALGQGAQATLKGIVGNVAIGSAVSPVSLDAPKEFPEEVDHLNVTINGDQYWIRLYKEFP